MSCRNVLDVATRHGEFVKKLQSGLKSYETITGIDNDPVAVQNAQEKCALPGVAFKAMDAYQMDFPDNSFDLVAISNSLHHLEEFPKVLTEMKRVLSPGGVLLINEMFIDNQGPAQQTHAALHTLEGVIDRALGQFHGDTFTRGEIVRIFCGLSLDNPVIFDDYETDPGLRQKLEKKLSTLPGKIAKMGNAPGIDYIQAGYASVQDLFSKNGIERCTQLVLMGSKAA